MNFDYRHNYYEGYLAAKYGSVGKDGWAVSYFELAREMDICSTAKAYGFWPVAVRANMQCSDPTRTYTINGQQLRELAIKHLAEIYPHRWQKELIMIKVLVTGDMHDEVVSYLKAAYTYYNKPSETPLMSDYEWDMLAKKLNDNYDSIVSPLKKYLVKDDLNTAFHLPWASIIEDLQ